MQHNILLLNCSQTVCKSTVHRAGSIGQWIMC